MHLEEGVRRGEMKDNENGYRKARGTQEERKREGEGRNGGGRLYNWGPKGRRQAQNGKRSTGGTSALGGNLFCADLVWKIRIVSPPSLALVLSQSLGRLAQPPLPTCV